MVDGPTGKPPGAGKSSFDLIEPVRLFAALGLKPGETFLDFGCGRGEYALAAAAEVGTAGLVYAVDLWEEGIAQLREEAQARGLSQIKGMVADVSRRIPLEDAKVDCCLLAAVLHDLVEAHTEKGALAEVARLVRTRGTLAVMEFKKIAGPPGPPLHIRLDPEEVENLVAPYGFERQSFAEVGPYNYVLILVKT